MSALRWENQTDYFRISVQKDLLGGLYLHCVSGKHSGRKGTARIIPCADLKDARARVRQLARTYRKKGWRFNARGSRGSGCPREPRSSAQIGLF